MDQVLINRIVTDVLAQLQPVSVRATPPASMPKTEVLVEHAVITADVLQDRIQTGQTLRIGPRSILTPTARDWLKKRQIRWQRVIRGTSTNNASGKRQLLISTITPAVRSIRDAMPREFPGWKCELLGNPAEIVETAVRALTAAETDLVVTISNAADAVACRANRNPSVRAAVVVSIDHLRLLADHLSPNLIAIAPRNRSYMEIRNLVRAIAALPAPRQPGDWT